MESMRGDGERCIGCTSHTTSIINISCGTYRLFGTAHFLIRTHVRRYEHEASNAREQAITRANRCCSVLEQREAHRNWIRTAHIQTAPNNCWSMHQTTFVYTMCPHACQSRWYAIVLSAGNNLNGQIIFIFTLESEREWDDAIWVAMLSEFFVSFFLYFYSLLGA